MLQLQLSDHGFFLSINIGPKGVSTHSFPAGVDCCGIEEMGGAPAELSGPALTTAAVGGVCPFPAEAAEGSDDCRELAEVFPPP